MKRFLSRVLFHLFLYCIMLPLVAVTSILEWLVEKAACVVGFKDWD